MYSISDFDEMISIFPHLLEFKYILYLTYDLVTGLLKQSKQLGDPDNFYKDSEGFFSGPLSKDNCELIRTQNCDISKNFIFFD